MTADSLSLVFSALADPTRRTILAQLAEGPKTVNEISRPFTLSLPAITKHLKVLERAGLVKVDKKAQTRPRTLDARQLAEAQAWIESYRAYWEASFDRLDAYLQEIQQTETP